MRRGVVKVNDPSVFSLESCSKIILKLPFVSKIKVFMERCDFLFYFVLVRRDNTSIINIQDKD